MASNTNNSECNAIIRSLVWFQRQYYFYTYVFMFLQIQKNLNKQKKKIEDWKRDWSKCENTCCADLNWLQNQSIFENMLWTNLRYCVATKLCIFWYSMLLSCCGCNAYSHGFSNDSTTIRQTENKESQRTNTFSNWRLRSNLKNFEYKAGRWDVSKCTLIYPL